MKWVDQLILWLTFNINTPVGYSVGLQMIYISVIFVSMSDLAKIFLILGRCWI